MGAVQANLDAVTTRQAAIAGRGDSLGQRWMNMTLVGTFAGAAVALCAIGVPG